MGDVRKTIQEVKNEGRKKYVLVILVILIIAGALWIKGPVQLKVPQYVNPQKLSYDLPNMNRPDVILTQQRIMSATCGGNNNMQCVEPIALQYFVQHIDTSSSGYEFYVFFRLKNSGSDATGITPSLAVRDIPCTYPGQPFSLNSGETSGRLDFMCPVRGSTGNILATLNVSYTSGSEKTAQIGMVFR